MTVFLLSFVIPQAEKEAFAEAQKLIQAQEAEA